MVVYNK